MGKKKENEKKYQMMATWQINALIDLIIGIYTYHNCGHIG